MHVRADYLKCIWNCILVSKNDEWSCQFPVSFHFGCLYFHVSGDFFAKNIRTYKKKVL